MTGGFVQFICSKILDNISSTGFEISMVKAQNAGHGAGEQYFTASRTAQEKHVMTKKPSHFILNLVQKLLEIPDMRCKRCIVWRI